MVGEGGIGAEVAKVMGEGEVGGAGEGVEEEGLIALPRLGISFSSRGSFSLSLSLSIAFFAALPLLFEKEKVDDLPAGLKERGFGDFERGRGEVKT